MSKRQNRVKGSSSVGDIGLFSKLRPFKSRAATVSRPKAPKQREQPRRSILTLGSPPRESDEDGNDIGKGFGVFFQSCFYCKKELGLKKDVFMAGYLRSFCSEACRTTHIDLEEAEKDLSSQPCQLLISFKSEGP